MVGATYFMCALEEHTITNIKCFYNNVIMFLEHYYKSVLMFRSGLKAAWL